MDAINCVRAWENRGFPHHCRFSPKPIGAVIYYTVNTWEYYFSATRQTTTPLQANLAIGDAPTVTAYCESFPILAWTLKFPTPVVVASALLAHSLSLPPLSVAALRRLPFFCLPHPPPFSPSPSPYTSSLLLLSRRIVGLWERKDIASIGVLVRVCGRWRLLWQGESEIRGWWWGAELRRIQVITMKQLNFNPCAVACVHSNVLAAEPVVRSNFLI